MSHRVVESSFLGMPSLEYKPGDLPPPNFDAVKYLAPLRCLHCTYCPASPGLDLIVWPQPRYPPCQCFDGRTSISTSSTSLLQLLLVGFVSARRRASIIHWIFSRTTSPPSSNALSLSCDPHERTMRLTLATLEPLPANRWLA
jgi:hypothetical protein